MKKYFLLSVLSGMTILGFAQNDQKKPSVLPGEKFTIEKSIAATPVKNQGMTGTCWCFSTTSLIESQCQKKNLGTFDISEMFTVRNIYIEKAKNYILRQGHTQFGEGGLGHDMIRAIATYGAMPESVYSGLNPKLNMHNHQSLVVELKAYLDNVLKTTPITQNWLEGYVALLNANLGEPPADFMYNGKKYTPKAFATEVLRFDPTEYVNITSFTHHPYYTPFIIEVPDNFSNGSYYNLPLNEMIQVTKDAIRSGYSVLWDADVSNTGFKQQLGIALNTDRSVIAIKDNSIEGIKERKFKNNLTQKPGMTDAEAGVMNSNSKAKDSLISNKLATETREEVTADAETRQALFENLTTQDDHLMHITGLEKSTDGKTFFLVKNSWGDIGPDHGYINVSEAYFGINTISLIVPKSALSRELLSKLGVR